MARMHSGARGKSGSKKPIKKSVPSWLKYKPKEVELLISKYGKEGKSPSQIGIYLRDEYGIPDSKLITSKSITLILKEKKLGRDIPEDLYYLIRKSLFIRKHLAENKKDQPARLGLKLTESKIMRLSKYYKRNKILPENWQYDPEKAKIYTS
ncbi:MAG: 30S ribosomal protein S15 [Nanoarchaeota archaeon]